MSDLRDKSDNIFLSVFLRYMRPCTRWFLYTLFLIIFPLSSRTCVVYSPYTSVLDVLGTLCVSVLKVLLLHWISQLSILVAPMDNSVNCCAHSELGAKVLTTFGGFFPWFLIKLVINLSMLYFRMFWAHRTFRYCQNGEQVSRTF